MQFQDKTRGGYLIHFHTFAGRNSTYPIIGEVFANNEWNLQRWTIDGKYCHTCSEHAFDLIPIPEFKVDDKVLVRDDDSQKWQKRYFAMYDSFNNKYCTFLNGRTSFTTDGKPRGWEQCIPYDSTIMNVYV